MADSRPAGDEQLLYHDREPFDAEELLRVATRGRTRALGIGNDIGSIETGKKADFILCDVSAMDHQPIYDPLFVAASCLVGRDVSTVVVDGKIVMKDREMLAVDVERLKARLAERLPIISERFEKIVA